MAIFEAGSTERMEEDTGVRSAGVIVPRARKVARSLALAGAMVALTLHLVASARSPSETERGPALAAVGSPAEARALAPAFASRGGERLFELLRPSGLSSSEISNLIELVRPFTDPERLAPGVLVAYARTHAGSPGLITLRLDPDRTLRFELSGARWIVRLDSIPVTRDTVVVAGLVSSHLYSAGLSGDSDLLSVAEKGDLAGHLSRVFAWQIDFYRDVRPRDAFRLALQRELRPDGSVRASRVLAAEYMSQGSLLTAVRFRPVDAVEGAFYDEGGSGLRGAFLKAPLDLVRVTSRFGARFHPMMGGFRAHQGVDYGAGTGTPVRATGEGTVERAGWRGDYGLMIEIRHGSGIRTRYAHLSAVEGGVRPGASVTQGQTIGRVGSTGLSTAPHLHYEFLLRSIPTDPARVDLPVERPIPDEDRLRFARARAASWLLLSRVSWPGDPFNESLGGRVGNGGHIGP